MLISLRSTTSASRRGAAVLGVALLGTLASVQAASAAAFLPTAGVGASCAMRAAAALADELSRGDLVAPFHIALEGYGYHIVWAQNVKLSQTAANFLDWILAQLEAPL